MALPRFSCNSIATIFCVAGPRARTRVPSHLLSLRPTFSARTGAAALFLRGERPSQAKNLINLPRAGWNKSSAAGARLKLALFSLDRAVADRCRGGEVPTDWDLLRGRVGSTRFPLRYGLKAVFPGLYDVACSLFLHVL